MVDGEPGQLNELKAKYEHCFTSSMAESALSGTFSTSTKDFSICSDEMAQRLGFYNVQNCGTTLTTADVTANNCSIFTGAGDIVRGSNEAATPAVNDGGAGGSLPAYADTSPCPSEPGITPAGSGSAKRDGKDVSFTLCNIMGTATVNVVYAKNFLNLFKGAQDAGLDLSGGGGSYLPYDGAVGRWQERCGSLPITSKYSKPPCQGNRIAPPGKSNHELGLAVDLNCRGGLLGGGTSTRATFNRNDPCVAWVIANSPAQGLYLQCEGTKGDGCESWHISPTGG
jgi:D-alanyl-D-alanine carboxypeptidase